MRRDPAMGIVEAPLDFRIGRARVDVVAELEQQVDRDLGEFRPRRRRVFGQADAGGYCEAHTPRGVLRRRRHECRGDRKRLSVIDDDIVEIPCAGPKTSDLDHAHEIRFCAEVGTVDAPPILKILAFADHHRAGRRPGRLDPDPCSTDPSGTERGAKLEERRFPLCLALVCRKRLCPTALADDRAGQADDEEPWC
jgi:hypothetical protein